MRIIPIPVRTDNYAYLLVDTLLHTCAAIDPVDPAKIQQVALQNKLSITSILTTHHHSDHAGGNLEMLRLYPGIHVYGGDPRIPGLTRVVSTEPFKVASLTIQPLLTPCHTTGHVCYYVDNGHEKAVFTGDTLFSGGCGRFFEGNAQQMYNALINTLSKLDNDTKVFFGHEYTRKNLEFAQSVDPQNKELIAYQHQLQGISTPSTIGLEKKINPFMRVNEKKLQKSLGVAGGIEAMHALRALKDRF